MALLEVYPDIIIMCSASINSLSWPVSQSLSPGGSRVEDIVHGHQPPEVRGHSDPHDHLVTTAQVHSASFSVGAPSESQSQSRHSPSDIRSEGADTWSHAMEYEDEFAWSVQQFDNSVASSVMGDGRLSQDYDDIDYTSGNLVSFHTSLAR